MNFLAHAARVHPARLAKGLTTLAAVGFLMISTGCTGGDDPAVEPPFIPAVDSSVSSVIPVYDSGSPGYVPPVSYDAGVVLPIDAGKPVIDTGAPQTTHAGSSPIDAGSIKVDAATDAGGGGFVFPDLFPRNDAGPTPTTDGGTGGRDVNGPCKDLGLLCFDFVDMFINAECFTCNGGKGCQGCAIPFAY
jgi:hypothetical protein